MEVTWKGKNKFGIATIELYNQSYYGSLWKDNVTPHSVIEERKEDWFTKLRYGCLKNPWHTMPMWSRILKRSVHEFSVLQTMRMALLALLPHNNLFHILLIIKPLGLKLVWFDKFFKGLKSVVDKPSIAKRLQGKHSHINIAAYKSWRQKSFPKFVFTSIFYHIRLMFLQD